MYKKKTMPEWFYVPFHLEMEERTTTSCYKEGGPSIHLHHSFPLPRLDFYERECEVECGE